MKKIGRYDIISELGRGAMGIVYRASDPTIGREVALKVLSLSAAPDEGTNSPQEMFMREVRAAGRLTHPSIVTIHDAFDDKESQTSCIVMELVPGVTLEKILDSGRRPTIEQALNLVRQVAEALDYAHRNQVIHRDLKPANILVTEDGRAKITDFGIAKVLAREGVARTVGIMGTPSYMSPEQVTGGEVDARTDIFSLGIIIFTMLTGQKPFSGNTAAVMFKIVYDEPPAPSSLNPQLTPAQDYVIRKCLEKVRNLRYSSVRELLGDLDDLQHDRPPRSQAAPSTPAPAAPRAPAATPPMDRTLTMRAPGPLQPAFKQALPRPAIPTTPLAPSKPVAAPPPKPAAPPPVTPIEAEGPVPPPRFSQTLVMPIPSLMKGVSQSASPPVVSAPPASTPAPLPPLQPAVPPPVVPTADPNARPLTGRTLPMPVPDLSAAIPSVPISPPAAPTPSVSHVPTVKERTAPLPVPDLSAASRVAGPPPDAFILPLPSDAARAVETEETPGAEAPPPKSKLTPVIFGGVAVVLLAVVTWGYWKFHRVRTPPPPPPVAVQTPVETPPAPVPTPVETPAPPPAAVVEAPPPPASAAPEVVKKTAAHKPKRAIAPAPSGPAPGSPPAQPEPAIVTPPTPSPAPPSPEAIAKVEAAKLANVPRVVQVVCNYSLKEATYTFSSGGQVLLQETFKAKKKKGGFLGIKGAYEGTFSQTITVPAGASEVSIHVVSKDGGTDLVKAVKVPPPGGFVPTLAVEVDNDQISPVWKGSSAAK